MPRKNKPAKKPTTKKQKADDLHRRLIDAMPTDKAKEFAKKRLIVEWI